MICMWILHEPVCAYSSTSCFIPCAMTQVRDVADPQSLNDDFCSFTAQQIMVHLGKKDCPFPFQIKNIEQW